MDNIITKIYDWANYICGMPVLYATIIVSLILLVSTKGFVFRYAGHIFREIIGKGNRGSSEKGISSFSACCTALGNTLGVGNIAGIAVGLAYGGPGALFWIWVAGLLGIAIKYSEVTLGAKYRTIDPNTGMYRGGIMWYIELGAGKKWKWLAILFVILYGFTDLTVPAVQINSIVGVFCTTWEIPPILIGFISAVLIAFVLLGGIRRLSDLANKVIPFAAVLFFGVSLVVLLANLPALPSVFKAVFVDAFTGAAAAGGFAGATTMAALRHGIMRGFYSNGAATGDAAFAHSIAEVEHPVQQGMWGAAEVVIDIIVCSCTALVILSTGVLETGLEGTALTTAAFQTFLGNQKLAALFVGIVVALFAFTTAIVCAYYGEICVQYLVNNPKIEKYAVPLFRFTICVFAVIGSVVPLNLLWMINDYCLVVCMFTCMAALLLNRKNIAALTKEYVDFIKKKA